MLHAGQKKEAPQRSPFKRKRTETFLKRGQVSPLQKELIQEAVKHLKVPIKLTTESQPS